MAIHDNGVDVQVYKKLDDPIFVDYLWYRTGQINHASPARAGLYFLRAIRICRHAKKHLHSKIITPASAFDFSPLAD